MLANKGPFLVNGYFGIDSYKLGSEFKLTTIANADIFAWKKNDYIDEAGQASHATIIVGVKLDNDKPDQSRIFFLDPRQTLDPCQRYKIYSVNFSKYMGKVKSIYSLSGYNLTKENIQTLEKPFIKQGRSSSFFPSNQFSNNKDINQASSLNFKI